MVFFAPAKQLALPTAKIDSQWRADGDGYALTLTSNTLAREVWLSFGDVDATLSDNAFDLLPGEPLTVHVSSKAALAQLQSTLQVRDLAATLAGCTGRATGHDGEQMRQYARLALRIDVRACVAQVGGHAVWMVQSPSHTHSDELDAWQNCDRGLIASMPALLIRSP